MRPEAHAEMAALTGAARDLVTRYSNGWDRALRGDPAPDLEAHLIELPESDQAGARAALERVDQEYRAGADRLLPRRITKRLTSPIRQRARRRTPTPNWISPSIAPPTRWTPTGATAGAAARPPGTRSWASSAAAAWASSTRPGRSG